MDLRRRMVDSMVWFKATCIIGIVLGSLLAAAAIGACILSSRISREEEERDAS